MSGRWSSIIRRRRSRISVRPASQSGYLVEVKGTTILADGALRATRVDREDHDFDGRSGDDSEVEGFVTRFGSATDFDVDGQKVATNTATVFVNGTAADLKLNVKVEVEGKFDSSNTLVAAKVAFKRQSTARNSRPWSTASTRLAAASARLGVTVMVSNTTFKEDHQGDDHFFNLGDLRVGDWVEVGGYVDPAGTGKLIATRLERDDSGGPGRTARSGERHRDDEPQGVRRQRRTAAGHRVRGRRRPHQRQRVPRARRSARSSKSTAAGTARRCSPTRRRSSVRAAVSSHHRSRPR